MPNRTLIIDGNNVVGAGAGGWWKDPPAAFRRLLDRLGCYAEGGGVALCLVLDVPQPDLPEGSHGGVVLRYATRKGADAADDRIVELLAEVDVGEVAVVTSDRALREQVQQHGAEVIGAGAFLRLLETAGC
jgi:predicted RNA-binding protein with PIN domain